MVPALAPLSQCLQGNSSRVPLFWHSEHAEAPLLHKYGEWDIACYCPFSQPRSWTFLVETHPDLYVETLKALEDSSAHMMLLLDTVHQTWGRVQG